MSTLLKQIQLSLLLQHLEPRKLSLVVDKLHCQVFFKKIMTKKLYNNNNININGIKSVNHQLTFTLLPIRLLANISSFLLLAEITQLCYCCIKLYVACIDSVRFMTLFVDDLKRYLPKRYKERWRRLIKLVWIDSKSEETIANLNLCLLELKELHLIRYKPVLFRSNVKFQPSNLVKLNIATFHIETLNDFKTFMELLLSCSNLKYLRLEAVYFEEYYNEELLDARTKVKPSNVSNGLKCLETLGCYRCDDWLVSLLYMSLKQQLKYFFADQYIKTIAYCQYLTSVDSITIFSKKQISQYLKNYAVSQICCIEVYTDEVLVESDQELFVSLLNATRVNGIYFNDYHFSWLESMLNANLNSKQFTVKIEQYTEKVGGHEECKKFLEKLINKMKKENMEKWILVIDEFDDFDFEEKKRLLDLHSDIVIEFETSVEVLLKVYSRSYDLCDFDEEFLFLSH